MKAFVAVTDDDWFSFLSSIAPLDEVNFWQPGGGKVFRALSAGEPLLFKLHFPNNFIVGGGFFVRHLRLPISRVWQAFGTKNGAATFETMRARVERIRQRQGHKPEPLRDYEIGCIILEEPFFLPRDRWIPAPTDFAKAIVAGKRYSLTEVPGRDLWQRVTGERASLLIDLHRPTTVDGPIFGDPALRRPRLGQGTFQALVVDAYGRRCAISGEKALPVLETAHIRPVSQGGEHRMDNGLLLRSDIHTLFDCGYIAVRPDTRTVLVSRKLKDDFDNGEPYYPLRGQEIARPQRKADQPNREFFQWHLDAVFRG